MDRPPPQYNIEEKPKFLYRSPFRENPDREYESIIDRSLRNIEEKALAENNGNIKAKETIWQIMLDTNTKSIDRGPDSIAFEHLITSNSASSFIRGTFNEVPDLVRVYNSYPYDVLRADLLRYLILWYYGGYYTDLDVYPARPIKSCPALNPLFQSPSYESRTPSISLVLGIEIDEPYASPQLIRDWHWSRIYGFIQYNMYAPRRFSPFLRRAIVRVLSHTRQHSQKSTLFFKSKYTEDSILEITGPGMFTDAILDVLSETLDRTHPLVTMSMEKDRGIGELSSSPSGLWGRVTWGPFHRLKDSLWVDAYHPASNKDMGGLVILPTRVWGNGQRHSEAGYFHDVDACVNHRFGRTWKKGWWEYFFG
ncbi:hypothetical protein PHISCL_04329 [Aspergillus sclerotialis]|uniref:Glycosyltransferase family 32 protein n=1 Tax=Aspergillus sclerotialis TaxID=2070753 RepID=A0A3A2ZM17_9EURO|nr:hypothetical protein PHISCL_04329 [Aspergillus sclerotialis]